MKKFTLFLLLAMLSISALAQPTRDKNSSYEETDYVIKKKLYNWNDRVELTPKTALKANKDIWYYKLTDPRRGYVYLKDGSYIEGDIVRKKVYNRASFVEITAEGSLKKIKDPTGVSYYELMITPADGKVRNFKFDELLNYGLFYTLKDYDENAFNPGFIYLKNGDILSGYVRSIWYKSPYETLKYYGKFYFAPNEAEFIECIQSEDIQKVIQQRDGEDITYSPLGDWLVRLDEYVKSFGEFAEQNNFESFKPGVVFMQDGQVLKGKIAMDQGKNKENAFYISEQESSLKDLRAGGISCIKVEGKEGLDTYIPQHGVLKSYDDLMKGWTKKNEIIPGRIVFNNGSEIKGSLVLGLDKSNMVKSYRNIETIYSIPENSTGFVQVFNASKDINYVMASEKKGENKYVPLNGIFVDYNDLVVALEKISSKDPTEMLQDGVITYVDGTSKAGRIAGATYKMSFIGENNQLLQYEPTATDQIAYYTQTIEGVERKFMPMQRRPNLLGADHMFVEILSPNETYSYFKNPMPTNPRKGLTNFVNNQVDYMSSQLSDGLAQLAAREAAKETYGQTENLGQTAVAANKAYTNTYNEIQGVISSDDDELYYDEWVVINNKTNESIVVFPKNDKEELTKLINTCPQAESLAEKEIKQMAKFNNIHKVLEYLNSCD